LALHVKSTTLSLDLPAECGVNGLVRANEALCLMVIVRLNQIFAVPIDRALLPFFEWYLHSEYHQ